MRKTFEEIINENQLLTTIELMELVREKTLIEVSNIICVNNLTSFIIKNSILNFPKDSIEI